MESWFLRIYKSVVIDRPIISLALVFFLVAFFATQSQNFKLDASAESIVLENDQDLKYYRASREVYGSDDFLIITYTPSSDLFSASSLAGLKALRDDLAQLRTGIHQRYVRAEEHAVGAGFGDQLFNDTGGAEGRAGFQIEIWPGLCGGEGLAAEGLGVAGVAGDKLGIGEAGGGAAELLGRRSRLAAGVGDDR